MIIIDSLWLWWLWSFRLVYLVLVVAFFLGLEGDDKHVVAVVEKNILSFFFTKFYDQFANWLAKLINRLQKMSNYLYL